MGLSWNGVHQTREKGKTVIVGVPTHKYQQNITKISSKYLWNIIRSPVPVVPHKAVAEVSKIGNL